MENRGVNFEALRSELLKVYRKCEWLKGDVAKDGHKMP